MDVLRKRTGLDAAALDAAIMNALDAIVALLTGSDAHAVALTALLRAGGHKPSSKIWKLAMNAPRRGR